MGLTTVLAMSLGILAGPWLRGLVFAHSVPGGNRSGLAALAEPRSSPSPCGGWSPSRPPTAVVPPAPPASAHPGGVETPAAAILTALALHAPSGWILAAWIWLGLLGIALTLVDTAVHRLPDTLTTATTCGVLAFLIADTMTTGDLIPLIRAITCAVGLGAMCLAAILAPGGMGRGDGHLALGVGLVLGWIGISAAWLATLIGAGLAGTTIAIGRLTRTLQPKDQVALGPFILAGTLAAVLITG